MEISEWKKLVEDLKVEWRMLWRSRIEDRVRAEGIANEEYARLFVERGTIIIATRDYKPPSFREILEQHLSPDLADAVNPSPSLGGIGKFIREMIRRQMPSRRRRSPPPEPKRSGNQQVKKGGRGWVHFRMK